MKIGFAARYSPEDKRAWSGIHYFTWRQLQQYGEVSIFHYRLPKLLQEFLTTRKSIHRRIFKKQTATEFTRVYAKYFSRQLSRDLEKNPVDILFVPASSQLVAYVKTRIPIIYMTDATFEQLQGYYPGFSGLSRKNIREGIALDRSAFQRAAHCLLASDWCARSAIRDYAVLPKKVSVVPMGANLEIIPAKEMLPQKTAVSCHLLFLGVEWERKGGAIVWQTFRLLQEQGFQPRLQIIGCVPPYDLKDEEAVSVIPFLDKNREEDREKLQQVLSETDFLFLPSRAECAGIVFCEASAYGIPSISTDTGGVTTYVRNGINGYTLPVEATAPAYASLIGDLCRDQDQLRRLKLSSRKLFEDELNWDNWGQHFEKIAKDLLRQNPGSR